MNERIKNLLMEARLFCYDDGTVSLLGETYVGQAEIEEFAELIVKKCISIVKQRWINPDEDVIAEEIKQHFGVK